MALWDGRFDGGPAEEMKIFGSSLDVDLLMWEEDIQGSKAHAQMLFDVGLLSQEELGSILRGLDLVAEELRAGWKPSIDDEDIHMAVEGRLHQLIGEPAGKLHTARSRNDQVATDLRLWLRSRMLRLEQEIKLLVEVLLNKIEKEGKVLVPGCNL